METIKNTEEKKLEKGVQRKLKWSVRNYMYRNCANYQNDLTMHAHESVKQIMRILEAFTCQSPTGLLACWWKKHIAKYNSLKTETALRSKQ